MKRFRNYLSHIIDTESYYLYGNDVELPISVSLDSREIKKGDTFIALSGENSDGHNFIHDAIARGAKLILAEVQKYKELELSLPTREDNYSVLLTTCSTYEAMESLACRYLNLDTICLKELIAITGSVGKTTTREMVKLILSSGFRVFGARKSYNTLTGCAATVLQMPADTEMLVLEMGTNNPGEIASLVRTYAPTISVITAVSDAHLEGFRDRKGVLNAKMEITESPMLKHIFYNADDYSLSNAISTLPEDIIKTGVGFSAGEYRITETSSDILDNRPVQSLTFLTPQKEIRVQPHIFGDHQSYCLAMAMALAAETGIILSGDLIDNLKPESGKGRGAFYYLKPGFMLIDDSYNANPASMKAALVTMKNYKWGARKIAILGEMKELGSKSQDFHKDILKILKYLNNVILVGQEWLSAVSSLSVEDAKRTIWVEDREKVYPLLPSLIQKEDMILVKGSHSNGLDQIVEELINIYGK